MTNSDRPRFCHPTTVPLHRQVPTFHSSLLSVAEQKREHLHHLPVMPPLLFALPPPLRPRLPTLRRPRRTATCALHANGEGGNASGSVNPPGGANPPTPSRAARRALREQLDAAVAEQRFSDAAALRDAVAAAEAAALQVDDEAVLAANDDFYAAFRSTDMDLMRDVWLAADSVSCAHPLSGLVSGYEEVMSSWTSVFSMGKPVSLEIEEVSVNVKPNVAWVVVKQDVEAVRGSMTIGGTRIATNVFQKRHGKWAMVHHHASPVISGEDEEQTGGHER